MIPRTVWSAEPARLRSSVRRFLQDEVVPRHDVRNKAGPVARA